MAKQDEIRSNLTEQYYRQPPIENSNSTAEVVPIPNTVHPLLKCRFVFHLINKILII